MLISKKGLEIFTQFELDVKNQNTTVMQTKLNPVDEWQIKNIPLNQGCTACVVLITKEKIYCANAGDSRAILAMKDGTMLKLSNDHKPDYEKERIEKAGGQVDQNRI